MLILNETGSLSRDSMVSRGGLSWQGTEEERLRIEKDRRKPGANPMNSTDGAPLVSDAEDRRLFDDTKRTRAALPRFATAFWNWCGKTGWRVGSGSRMVFPAYGRRFRRLRFTWPTTKGGMAAGNTGKRDAESNPMHIIGFVSSNGPLG